MPLLHPFYKWGCWGNFPKNIILFKCLVFGMNLGVQGVTGVPVVICSHPDCRHRLWFAGYCLLSLNQSLISRLVGTSNCSHSAPHVCVDQLSGHIPRLSKQKYIYCNEEESSTVFPPIFPGIFLTKHSLSRWLSMEICSHFSGTTAQL